MSPKVEKKTVQIGVKISDSLNSLIEEICTNEDRPVGYVARELMIRGLALYRLDGKLRDDVQTSVQPASKIAAYIGPGDKTQVRRRFQEEVEVPTRNVKLANESEAKRNNRKTGSRR